MLCSIDIWHVICKKSFKWENTLTEQVDAHITLFFPVGPPVTFVCLEIKFSFHLKNAINFTKCDSFRIQISG